MIIIQVDCYHLGRYKNEGITNSLTYQVLSCRYFKHPIEIVTFSNAQNSCDKVWFLNELLPGDLILCQTLTYCIIVKMYSHYEKLLQK